MSGWNGLDFFIFLIFLINTLLGFSRGSAKETISLLCVCAGLIITIKYTVPVAAFMESSPTIQDAVNNRFMQNFLGSIGAGPLTLDTLKQVIYSISLLICFVGTFSATEAVLHFTGVVEVYKPAAAIVNRKLGAALGCTRGYIFNLILMLILTQHIFISNDSAIANNIVSRSFFVNLFQGATQKLDSIIAEQDPDKYKEIFQDKNLYNEGNVIRSMMPHP